MGHLVLPVLSILSFLSALVLVGHRRRRSDIPYPPGPTQKWIIGNVVDMPRSFPWLRFSEWGVKYGGPLIPGFATTRTHSITGEITYVNLLGQPTVILNTLEACRELLETRGANNAGRPYSAILDLMGLSKGTTQHQDTARWRYQRRLIHTAFGPQAVKHYHPIHELHVIKLLERLFDPSTDCVTEVRFAIGQIMLAITYGLPVEKHFDEFTRMNEAVAEAFVEANVPGRYLVDSIPILRYVPMWFPGASFKRYAAYISELAARQAVLYYDEVKDAVAMGTASPSFVSNCLNAQAAGDVKSPLANRGQDEDALAWAASSMYRALAGTTTASLPSVAPSPALTVLQSEQTVLKFITAMQLYPDIQRKAQEEIARVVGTERLPTVADRESLPYLSALISETLRWHAAFAIGIPHRTAKDDVYKGCFIPKNTNIIFNARSSLSALANFGADAAFPRNLTLRAEDGSPIDRPEEFNPERFFSQEGSRPINPADYVFGFGRRICPGRHIAHDIIFLMISGILSTFWISKPVDEHGEEMPLHVEWTGNGSVSYPQPVHPRFTARSALAVCVIDRVRNAESEVEDGERPFGVRHQHSSPACTWLCDLQVGAQWSMNSGGSSSESAKGCNNAFSNSGRRTGPALTRVFTSTRRGSGLGRMASPDANGAEGWAMPGIHVVIAQAQNIAPFGLENDGETLESRSGCFRSGQEPLTGQHDERDEVSHDRYVRHEPPNFAGGGRNERARAACGTGKDAQGIVILPPGVLVVQDGEMVGRKVEQAGNDTRVPFICVCTPWPNTKVAYRAQMGKK
ncbi:cytochrome P450 [Auricularia subglabra TFB-10046 SS5]|nr:cytochrome P450 [Auricularia subglabra TFB-10046 SS5]